MDLVLRRRRWRRSHALMGAILIAGMLGGASAIAQTGGPVASGSFTGSLGLDGGFRYGADGVEVTVRVDGAGPLAIELQDGVMTGTWSFSGVQTMNGEFEGGSMVGAGTFDGDGTVEGPPSDYRMLGTWSSTNTATVDVAGLSQSATTSDTGEVNEPFTDVLLLCDQIVGRWDLRVRQEIESVGFDEFIRGYFTASTGRDAAEQADDVENLIADINTWAARPSSHPAETAEPGGRAVFMSEGVLLLHESQLLQAELGADTPCPPDPRFVTELTLAVQDVLNTLLDEYPGITTSYVVSLALGSGAIGAGSTVPDAAAALEDRLVGDVQGQWDSELSTAQPSSTELLDIARAAQMLGITDLGNGVSPADVLLVIGEGS